MNKAIENLLAAQKKAIANRPKVGGFPYFAEVLRSAGVIRNLWSLPSCQSMYVTEFGAVAQQGTPLISEPTEIPIFNEANLIQALRTDQAGESTFPEFLKSAWEAGVVGYNVDFENRRVSYFGVAGETYVEEYPEVEI